MAVDYGLSRIEPLIQSIALRLMCDAQRPRLVVLLLPSGKEVLAEALTIAKEVMSPEEYLVTKVEFGIME